MKNLFEADVSRLGYVGRQPGKRDSDSWFTPSQYVEAARSVLGRIDLDPFSSAEANLTVGARHYFTEADDAFTKVWAAGTVWMNPPYGRAFRASIEKFVNEFTSGHFRAGIVLCNNATETRAGQLLFKTASAVAFPDHRISFTNVDGKKVSGNTRGQMFAYFGPKVALFRKVFSQFGSVLTCR